MMINEDIKKLKEKVKKGTISYFDLNEEEIKLVTEELKKEIKNTQNDINDIKEKIKIERNKIKNSSLK